MVHTCIAVGCHNRKTPGSCVSFYRFPRDCERKRRWIAAVKRVGWEPSDSSRLCSQHFILGKQSKNPLSPDYVPSVFEHVSSPVKGKPAAPKTKRKLRENHTSHAATLGPPAVCTGQDISYAPRNILVINVGDHVNGYSSVNEDEDDKEQVALSLQLNAFDRMTESEPSGGLAHSIHTNSIPHNATFQEDTFSAGYIDSAGILTQSTAGSASSTVTTDDLRLLHHPPACRGRRNEERSPEEGGPAAARPPRPVPLSRRDRDQQRQQRQQQSTEAREQREQMEVLEWERRMRVLEWEQEVLREKGKAARQKARAYRMKRRYYRAKLKKMGEDVPPSSSSSSDEEERSNNEQLQKVDG